MAGFCICKSLPYVNHSVIRTSILLFHRYISSIPNQNESFAASYLKNSLGFSQETAIKLTSSSRRLHFENPKKPDLVLKFFENHGFSKTQVSIIIKRYPKLLLSNPENSFLPKFEFLYSKGVAVPDLAKLFTSNPLMLRRSLQNYIIPTYNFLKTLLRSDEKVLSFLKRARCIWTTAHFISNAVPNIAILREYGVPESNILYLVFWQPQVFMTTCDRFREAVEEVKTLGFDSLQLQFVKAVHVKRSLNKSSWEKKLNVYMKCGWSDKDIMLAFAKHPGCMAHSQDKIMATMDFFVNKMRLESSMIARCPSLLSYSLEKRIIPRCLFFEALLSKGLIKNNISFTTLLILSEKKFLQRYVTCYEDEAPQLMKLYQENLDLATTEARVS